MEGDGVQLAGLRMGPGLGGADSCGKRIQQRGEPVHLCGGGGADGEGVARVADPLAVAADIDGFTLTVAGVGFQAELVKECQQNGLVR